MRAVVGMRAVLGMRALCMGYHAPCNTAAAHMRMPRTSMTTDNGRCNGPMPVPVPVRGTKPVIARARDIA